MINKKKNEVNFNTICGTLEYCRNNNMFYESKNIINPKNYFLQNNFKQELMKKLIKRNLENKNKINKQKEEAIIALHDFIRAIKNKKYINFLIYKKFNSKFNVLKILKENYLFDIINHCNN